MKTRCLSLTAALLGLFTLAGATAAHACKYCWAAEAAAGDLSQQSLLPQDQANNPPGAFPLESTISQFKPAPAPVALATPPPAGSIATSAADLRPATAPAVVSSPAPAPVAVIVASPATQSTVAQARGSGHFADAGLLSLAAVGGVFCWRTRRKSGSAR